MKEQLPVFDVLAFLKMSFLKHPGYLALNRNGGVSFDIANGAKLDRHRFLHRCRDQNRYRFAALASTTTAGAPALPLAGTALGFCRRVVLRFLIERPGLILLKAGEAADHYEKC